MHTSDEEAAAVPFMAAGSLRPGIVHRLDKGTTGLSTSCSHYASAAYAVNHMQRSLCIGTLTGEPALKLNVEGTYRNHNDAEGAGEYGGGGGGCQESRKPRLQRPLNCHLLRGFIVSPVYSSLPNVCYNICGCNRA